jgi:hypothetical protein
VVADIPVSSRTEQSIGNRVRHHIGIGVTFEAMRVWDFDSAQYETTPMY